MVLWYYSMPSPVVAAPFSNPSPLGSPVWWYMGLFGIPVLDIIPHHLKFSLPSSHRHERHLYPKEIVDWSLNLTFAHYHFCTVLRIFSLWCTIFSLDNEKSSSFIPFQEEKLDQIITHWGTPPKHKQSLPKDSILKSNSKKQTVIHGTWRTALLPIPKCIKLEWIALICRHHITATASRTEASMSHE